MLWNYLSGFWSLMVSCVSSNVNEEKESREIGLVTLAFHVHEVHILQLLQQAVRVSRMHVIWCRLHLQAQQCKC